MGEFGKPLIMEEPGFPFLMTSQRVQLAM